MRTTILNTALFVFSTLSTKAQTESAKRSLSKSELQRYFDVCKMITDALPNSFKNYTYIKKDCNDPSSFSLEMDGKGGYNTAINANNQAVGFLPTADISFINPSSDSLYKAVMQNFDYAKFISNADSINVQEAKMIKISACKTLKIVVTYNTGYSELYFDKSTSPELLNIPKSAFATLYKMPFGKPILEDDGSAQHHSDGDEAYTDKAVIVFGAKPTVRISKAENLQSYIRAFINVPDDGKLILLDKIKSLTISITGDEKDIKELVTKINWDKLNNLIGK